MERERNPAELFVAETQRKSEPGISRIESLIDELLVPCFLCVSAVNCFSFSGNASQLVRSLEVVKLSLLPAPRSPLPTW